MESTEKAMADVFTKSIVKLIFTCTNCKQEKQLDLTPELYDMYQHNELHLCTNCSNLWAKEVNAMNQRHREEFTDLQVKFGIRKSA